MTDRHLVTGATGQLGSDLVALLRADGRDVTALGHVDLDVSHEAAVADAVTAWAGADPAGRRVVFNAAAFTDVDGAEADEPAAFRANARAPGYLAAACAAADAVLVHVSTDYVFDGTASSPYDESAPVGPHSAYGRSKAAGEQAVLTALAEAYVVRTAWVYGAVGRNFVKTMARLERERETLQVVDDQRGSPTWSRDLAGALVALADSGADFGLYHRTSAGETTWCGLARAVFEELGADPSRVAPTTTAQFPRPAPRPAYSVLSDAKWRAAGLPAAPHWRDALHDAFATVGDALRAG